MKIVFISTRGIPNNYGGFEQFAEQISVRLAGRGHEVTVYSPHYHVYDKSSYRGVHIKHIYSPEPWLGSSVGSFFYDFFSLRDALRNGRPDIVYVAGYTSIVPAYMWYGVRKKKYPVFITNMDGLEYKRRKFNRLVRAFLSWEEGIAVRHSRRLVADNIGIRDYYMARYGRESTFLAYGADVPIGYDRRYLSEAGLEPDGYFIVVARMEPENNVAMAIEGYLASKWRGRLPLVVVGKLNTPYGRKLSGRYGREPGVRFMGGIYDNERLNALRHFSLAYFHGHSVGGTNPSLLEAMACGCFILSHDNIFNKTVLGQNAFYYTDAGDIVTVLDCIDTSVACRKKEFVANNLCVIRDRYSWDKLASEHERFFEDVLKPFVSL